MKKLKKPTDGVATEKRIKINDYQQQMVGMVLIAAVILGVGAVLAMFLVKHIAFNAEVLTAKSEAIEGYKQAKSNANSLYEEIINVTAMDENLESVGRGTVDACYGADGKKLNFSERYKEATVAGDEVKAQEALEMIKTCSALRVIPDALPAGENEEALMASLDYIFKYSNWEPESLSPSGSSSSGEVSGIETIPVSLQVKADTATTHNVLSNIEKSIRTFDINSATISWSGDDLELSAQASAYYTNEIGVQEEAVTVTAADGKITTTTGGASAGAGTLTMTMEEE